MRRIIAVSVGMFLAFAASPAPAQSVDNGWNSIRSLVYESDRQIVLKFRKADPGRIVYWTGDGACSGGMPWPTDPTPTTTCEPPATAPEDYTEVTGEMLFTEPGTREVIIPIVDDDRDEGFEYFHISASEGDDVARQTTWHTAVVSIYDERPDGGGGPGITTAPAAPTRQSDGPTVAAGARVSSGSLASATTAPTPAGPEVDAASAELAPGPGFELSIERSPAPASHRADDGVPFSRWLAVLAATTAAGVVGIAARRWRRWSPTRS